MPNKLLTKSQRNALIKWAKLYSRQKKLQFIWSEQDSPRPKRPYGTLRFLTGPVKSGADEERVCDDGSVLTSGPRQFTLSVNIYGEESLNLMATLQDSLDLPSCREYFRGHGLSVFEELGVQNLTSLIESEYEDRSQMDIIFNYASNVEDIVDPGIIETVELEGTHTGGKDPHVEECDVITP